MILGFNQQNQWDIFSVYKVTSDMFNGRILGMIIISFHHQIYALFLVNSLNDKHRGSISDHPLYHHHVCFYVNHKLH